MGQGAKRRDRPVSGCASAPQSAQRAADRVVELSTRRAYRSSRAAIFSTGKTPGCSASRRSTCARAPTRLPRWSSIRTSSPRKAPSRSRTTSRRLTPSCWPTDCPRAAPTGRRSKCATSRRARTCPTRCAGCASPTSRGRRTRKASTTRAIRSRPRARCSKPRSRVTRCTTTASAHRSPQDRARLRAQGSARLDHHWRRQRRRTLSVRLDVSRAQATTTGSMSRISETAKSPNVKAPVKPVIEADDAEYPPIGNQGSMVFLRSDKDAPNRKVIAVDLRNPAPTAWKTIVPEQPQAIETVAVIGGRVVAQYLVDVQSRLRLYGTRRHRAGRDPAAWHRHRLARSADARTRRTSGTTSRRR